MPEDGPNVEVQHYEILDEVSEFGKSRILIECPYCKTEVWAYKWSLAGHGKKCPKCGAIHIWFGGLSTRKIKQ